MQFYKIGFLFISRSFIYLTVCMYVYMALHLKDTIAYSQLDIVVHACDLSMC